MNWLLGLAAVLPWFLVAVLLWLGYQLILQNGRILLRLEGMEQRLGRLLSEEGIPGRPPGLATGSAAPEFELPDLEGREVSLSQFRGRPVLLIFFDPRCGFCTR